MALLKRLKVLAETFSKSASTHQTTNLPAFPYEQALKAVSTMVEAKTIDDASGDAAEFNINTGSASDAKVPHAGGTPVTLSARAGSASVAGQDIVLNVGNQLTTASGERTELATGGTYRLHSDQATTLGWAYEEINPADILSTLQDEGLNQDEKLAFLKDACATNLIHKTSAK
jgi:type VI secretion system secreted protein VgrG